MLAFALLGVKQSFVVRIFDLGHALNHLFHQLLFFRLSFFHVVYLLKDVSNVFLLLLLVSKELTGDPSEQASHSHDGTEE